MQTILKVIALLLLGFSLETHAADENLISNGDFEKGSDWADEWGRPKTGASLEKDKDNHFVRLTAGQPGETILLYKAIKVPEGVKAFELSYRVRAQNIKPGKELWFDARIVNNFKDESGEGYPSPPPVFFRKDTKDWVEKKTSFPAPEGATKLEFIAGLFQVESGTLEIDDIVLKAVGP